VICRNGLSARRAHRGCCNSRAWFANFNRHEEHTMLDVIMLAIGLAFFALSVGYVYACDQL
jgi:SNF family Na+-dependent transporter